jgi:hypothetical protein
MQKRPNIKWRQRDEKELERVVRNFNAKITKELKKHPFTGQDYLPEKKSLREEREKILQGTRQDFTREIKSLGRFSKKGAEKMIENAQGLKVTKWERQEIGYKVAQINRQRTAERKEIEQTEATSRGQSIGLKRGEMGDTRMHEARPKKFDFNKIDKGKEWGMFKESVEKQSMANYSYGKAARAQNNYITKLRHNFGKYADDLVRKIESMHPEDFIKVLMSEEQASFDFIDRVKTPLDARAILEYAHKAWGVELDEEALQDFDASEIDYIGSP